MTDLIRCTACGGRKVIKGLGMIEKNCVTCKGIGFIAKAEPMRVLKTHDEAVKKKFDAEISDVEEISSVKIKKKPGRKPKIVSHEFSDL